jgi:hypothetical protein
MSVDRALELWGNDPVHTSEAGYAALAQDIRANAKAPLQRPEYAPRRLPHKPYLPRCNRRRAHQGRGLDIRLNSGSEAIRPELPPEG